MSMEVALAELTAAVDRFAFAYLATVGDGQRAHIVAVRTVLEGDVFRLAKPGRTTGRNIGQRSAVTLVWPPADADDYSLIVDGTGVLEGEELIVTPVRAVLHRAAQPPVTNSSTSCGSDCIELPLPNGS
jgi:hypothetical protein